MARYSYERLSYEGAALLGSETSRHFGHALTTLVFDAGPLARPKGGVDFDAIRSAIESRLHLVPAYRRKLRRIPLENHPVLVDDREFNLDYHLRHIGVAQPGEIAQVQKVIARLEAQRLDRSRPLWECWVLEGLSEGRFALVLKQHAVLAETSGDLMQVLLSPDADETFEPAPPFVPRPMPLCGGAGARRGGASAASPAEGAASLARVRARERLVRARDGPPRPGRREPARLLDPRAARHAAQRRARPASPLRDARRFRSPTRSSCTMSWAARCTTCCSRRSPAPSALTSARAT